MKMGTIGRLAAMLTMAGVLAGCVDVGVDVEVTGQTTARATLTQSMGADFYTMVKVDAEREGQDAAAAADRFCADGALMERNDGGAICTIVREGQFSRLARDEDAGSLRFSSAGPGLVRVALPSAELVTRVGGSQAMDAEMRTMVDAFFAGRKVTVRFSGTEVLATNMTVSDDGTSAEYSIALLDLVNGSAELPEELYAVVRIP